MLDLIVETINQFTTKASCTHKYELFLETHSRCVATSCLFSLFSFSEKDERRDNDVGTALKIPFTVANTARDVYCNFIPSCWASVEGRYVGILVERISDGKHRIDLVEL